MLICRCEEITKGEIRKAVHDGMWTLTEIRRYLRTGMGLCQGRTCEKMVQQILAQELGAKPWEVGTSSARPPISPDRTAVKIDQDNKKGLDIEIMDRSNEVVDKNERD